MLIHLHVSKASLFHYFEMQKYMEINSRKAIKPVISRLRGTSFLTSDQLIIACSRNAGMNLLAQVKPLIESLGFENLRWKAKKLHANLRFFIWIQFFRKCGINTRFYTNQHRYHFYILLWSIDLVGSLVIITNCYTLTGAYCFIDSTRSWFKTTREQRVENRSIYWCLSEVRVRISGSLELIDF